MLFTLRELFDMTAITFILGFIFSSFFSDYYHHIKSYAWEVPVSHYGFDWQAFWFSALLVAPAIILHEMGHKFVAMSFGFQASFHAAYLWLFLALILKLLNFPFIFFVPAYVSFTGNPLPYQSALIAFAGPFVNFLLYLLSQVMIKRASKKQMPYWMLFSKLNLFLFIFNMLPIPGFDGFKVYANLIKLFA